MYSCVQPIATAFISCLAFFSVNLAMAQSVPRPEHPRPDFQRDAWMNLNGEWEFAETDDGTVSLIEADMPDKITVPFCRESSLSGLERKGFVDFVWYRRQFEVPQGWKDKRVLLHVGACDWETTAWVNGTPVGFHRGSSDAFAFDITQALRPGTNTVVFKVYDNVRSGLQPAGKQSLELKSHGIFYTRTTGIWQTVWLEAVGQTYLKNLAVTVSPDRTQITVRTTARGDRDGLQLEVAALMEGLEVGQASASLDWNETSVTLPLSKQRPWTLEDPFLYDLKLTLKKGEETVDQVESYFGLRTLEIQGRAITLNGKPVFQRLVLDQGFYPDGVWTAPSDEALENDIRLSQAVGFNGARLHQKVFEPRFLYHADRLGYLLWGEFPNFQMNFADARIDEPVIREWTSILERDRNHPSIIGWCPFNETPPDSARLQNILYDLTQQLDPSRPLLDTSGWTHTHSDPDLSDAHDYNQDPASFRQKWLDYFDRPMVLPARYGLEQVAFLDRPFFISEFGGIGWNITEGWGYGNTPESIEAFYERFAGLVDALLDNPNFFGYCYTQLTNIEQEQNGLYDYNRTPKFDVAKLHAIQSRRAAYEDHPVTHPAVAKEATWTVLVPSALETSAPNTWMYVEKDPGPSWNEAGFSDDGWNKGLGGFGTVGGNLKHTDWTGKDIWLRKRFKYDGAGYDHAVFLVWYDNKTEIFLNGEKVWEKRRWIDRYEAFDVTEAIRKNLREGENLLAVHTHQDEGGQYIDVGLLVGSSVDEGRLGSR